MSKERKSLAIVGTGLAGLSAAYLLKDKFDVTVFENHARAGMGIHTVDYHSNGKHLRIDVPLRVFCQGYYQNLTALYEHVGVQISGSDHSGVFADGDNRMLFHYGKFSFNGLSVAYPKGKSLVQINTLKIASQVKRFLANAEKDLKTIADINEWCFQDYLDHIGSPKELMEIVLLPQLSVTLTCDYQSVLNYPAELILKYLTCGIVKEGIIGAEKGVDDIVPRLLENVELKVNCGVTGIEQKGKKIRLTYSSGADNFSQIDNDSEQGNGRGKGGTVSSLFDHVVIASQAHQAAAMLNGFDKQVQLLKTVPFESSDMSVHTDTSLLPESRSDLSPVSYFIPKEQARPEVTVNLSKAFERYSGADHVFQTWNPMRDPDASKELARVRFTRPIVTLESRSAMAELRDCQQNEDNQIWFCGSYMADKIPLLDAAVDSSMLVARSLGADIPWEKMPEFHDLAELVLNDQGQSWGNLGYWQKSHTYSDACRDLARLLADRTHLNRNSRVMDIGFGCGDQLLLWLDEYRVTEVRGINYSESQTLLAKQKLALSIHKVDSEKVVQGSVDNLSLWRKLTHDCSSPNRILALDCAYHFPNKSDFFSQAYCSLESGGRLGVTDLMLNSDPITFLPDRLRVQAMLKLSRVPRHNLVTRDEYTRQLCSVGFTDIELLDISDEVMPKFKAWLEGYKQGKYTQKFHTLSWQQKLKYAGTANFLEWAYQKQVLRYFVVSARKP